MLTFAKMQVQFLNEPTSHVRPRQPDALKVIVYNDLVAASG
jgi:hypothetical protein